MKKIIVLLFILLSVPAMAQLDKRSVRSGNRKFSKDKFKEAEILYRKGVLNDTTSVPGQYNLANALYRQEDYDGAGKALDAVKEQESGASYNFNAGDVALRKKDYQAAVDAFRAALLKDPADMDAKENYIYAKKMLENQQNQGGGNQNQDNNQDQNNQDNQQDQNQDQQDNKDDQNKNQDQDQQNNQQQQQPQDQKISRQEAQQVLRAIQAKEKETQDKVNKEKAEQLQSRQKEKNW